jgi:hypothetical protein
MTKYPMTKEARSSKTESRREQSWSRTFRRPTFAEPLRGNASHCEFSTSSFGFRHSFVIRASTFVIFASGAPESRTII